ncbi:MAG: hypothetical protein AAFZ65_02755 [Planctomycetota bacterium]
MRTQILTLVAAAIAAAPALAQDVVINEIRIDDPSTDNLEFFELAGAPGTSLDGLFYITIGDGSNGDGQVEEVTDLAGLSIPADGFFVCVNTNVTAVASPDLVNGLSFENSDNVTHLLVSDFTGASGDDLDTDDDGVLDVTPWTAVLDQVALAEELTVPPTGTEFFYGDVVAGPDGSFVPGHIFREDDATGELTHWAIGIFDDTIGLDTPGEPNADAGRLPSSFGGGIGLALNFDASFAGQLYFVGASTSGTAPGLPLGGVVVPLNFDAVTNLSLTLANSGTFVNTLSTLDANGDAFAQIVLPAVPALVGQTLNAAAVVIDPFTGLAVAASNAGTVNLD